MAPKKKKAPKNSFSFFLQEFRKEMEKNGVRFPNMTEVVAAATPHWQTLSSVEKMKYERMAADYKLATKNDLSNKFTTTGKSYQEVQNELLLQQQKHNEMMDYITHTVAVLDRKQIQTKNFIFIHSNYYCHDDAGNIVPCEIAVCKFNFSQGAHSDYHQIINPGSIPLGYAYEANQKLTFSHKIPLPPHELGETDFSKIYKKLKGILQANEDGRLRPVYTFDNEIDIVKSTLFVLGRDEGLTQDDIRVYPLVKLFFELRNAAGAFAGKTTLAFPTESLALRELERDIYNFTPGISCKFHEDSDAGSFCSLSTIRRWCFLIADHCCKDLGINLVPGQHIAHTSSVWRTELLSSVPSTRIENPVAKAVIPSGNIVNKNVSDVNKRCVTPLTIIDHSKKMDSAQVGNTSSSESYVNAHDVGRRKMIQTCESSDTNVRRPYSRGIALQNALSPNFTSEDFPAFSESLSKKSQKNQETEAEGFTAQDGFFGKVPVRFAGRGSSVKNKSTGAIPKIGRGMNINFSGLSLDD